MKLRHAMARGVARDFRMQHRALVIGNSDGIGLAITRERLGRGFTVHGMSPSTSPIEETGYEHQTADVCGVGSLHALHEATRHGSFELVIYCAGIGERFDPKALAHDVATFETNLIGLVRTCEHVLPKLIAENRGPLVGLSSMADCLRSGVAPEYSASKAGCPTTLKRLALRSPAQRSRGSESKGSESRGSENRSRYPSGSATRHCRTR